MAGIKVRSLRGEEKQWAGQIRRLAEPALWHTRDKSFTHRRRVLIILIHPRGQWRTKHRRRDGIHGDSGRAPLAPERLGDPIDRGLGGTVSSVTRRMT